MKKIRISKPKMPIVKKAKLYGIGFPKNPRVFGKKKTVNLIK